MQAIAYWDRTNVIIISGSDIEDFLLGLKGIFEKTRHNKMSNLSDFFKSHKPESGN
jgi:hypothetical protein